MKRSNAWVRFFLMMVLAAKVSAVTGYKLQPGIYGIVLVDDENGSGKIDKNMVGIPKEGFGFSNFFMEQLKKPAFNDFKFNLKTGNNSVVIRVKYL